MAQREMRDKGGSAAPAGTPPGRLRPGRDSSPGSRQLLLLFFLELYNFVTLIRSPSIGSPYSIGFPKCPRDHHRPCSALIACAARYSLKLRLFGLKTAGKDIVVRLLPSRIVFSPRYLIPERVGKTGSHKLLSVRVI